jgi:starvation-inducible DNA-binding protein
MDMISELCEDNQQLTRSLRTAHDVATASLIEVWIDETEKCTWFLAEIERDA